jgi:hypothetical protein
MVYHHKHYNAVGAKEYSPDGTTKLVSKGGNRNSSLAAIADQDLDLGHVMIASDIHSSSMHVDHGYENYSIPASEQLGQGHRDELPNTSSLAAIADQDLGHVMIASDIHSSSTPVDHGYENYSTRPSDESSKNTSFVTASTRNKGQPILGPTGNQYQRQLQKTVGR